MKTTYFGDAAMQDNGMFYMTGPNSKPFPSSVNLDANARPTRLATVLDGQSNTIMFGERYHFDINFDKILHFGATKWSRYPIAKWGTWGWYGGGNGTTHAFASTFVPINYRTPPTAAANFANVNLRMSAFGSGHPAGATFALSDGSTRFISQNIDTITYQALSTRAGTEVIAGEY